ncbi:MAG: hypothetical protein ABJ275_08130 [Maricaulaceae bacterium]
MKFGVPISLLLHTTLIGSGFFVFTGAPTLLDQQKIIPIDIVAISEQTNIQATVKRPIIEAEPIVEAPTSQEEVEAPIVPDPAPVPTPDPVPVITEEVDISDTRPNQKSAEVVEAEVDPVEETETEDEPASFDLDNLSALIDRSRDEQPSNSQQRILQSEETLYAFADVTRNAAGAGNGLSLSETDALRSAMYKCWRIPADAKDPESLIVPVDVKLHRDGHVASVNLKNSAAVNNSSNPYMVVAAENALRAVSKCAPYDFLPAERYDSWKQMTLTFRPVLSQ